MTGRPTSAVITDFELQNMTIIPGNAETSVRYLLASKGVPFDGTFRPTPKKGLVYTRSYDPEAAATTLTWETQSASR